jgi:sugar lactone lactonase YvrE
MKNILSLIIIVMPFIVKAQSGIITTVAGNGTIGYSGDGHMATNATLHGPSGLRVDGIGNIYIADNGNNVIRKINTSNIITTIAGNGIAGYSGDGMQATNATLKSPTDVAVDAVGNIYIADNQNDVIRKVSASGIISTYCGNGSNGYMGDNGPATLAELNFPSGIAVDESGNLYIADEGNSVIRKVNTSGTIITIAGNGVNGFSGNNIAATSAELSVPAGVRVDVSGNIYIADFGNNVIWKVNTSGIISPIAGNGIIGYSGDGGIATSCELHNPFDVSVDGVGNIYIADNGNERIRKVSTSNIITTIAGNGITGYNGDNIPATAAKLKNPVGISTDGDGNIYIADGANNRVRKVIHSSTKVDTVIGLSQTNSISPNPATNTITISAGDKIENIAITNMVGQVIYNQLYNKVEKTDVEVAGWAAGVYFIKVNGVYAGKFVKE